MIGALSFLTIFGGAHPPDRAAARWFPAVGASLGAAVGGVWWGANELWDPGLAAAIAVGADLVLTGMLHLDGLADSGDGLLPPLPEERRLAVMADPAVGAFGLGLVVVVLLLRWAAVASLAPDVLLVVALWTASRTAMAMILHAVPYARGPGGLADGFLGGVSVVPSLLAGLVLAAASAAVADGATGLAAIAAALLAGWAVVAWARRRLGGFTGDVLGAVGLTVETIGLIVAAARW